MRPHGGAHCDVVLTLERTERTEVNLLSGPQSTYVSFFCWCAVPLGHARLASMHTT